MLPCGDDSLRRIFQGKLEVTHLRQGILNYTRMQRQLEGDVQLLLSLGLPDWRLDKLPSLYQALIEKKRMLLDDGLTEDEIDQLHRLFPACIKLCDSLSKYKIPDTINHCDFHENNMLLDKKGQEINIIDWGETVITHPFLSLNNCLWNIAYFYDVDKLYRSFAL